MLTVIMIQSILLLSTLLFGLWITLGYIAYTLWKDSQR